MLKQTLSLLLSKFYSKQESADVGHQAMPSASSVSITLPASNGTTEKEYSYTAPSDGYIVLRDKGYPKTASYVISNQYAEGITRPQSAIDINICTPVTKGSVTYLRYCGNNPTAQFIKLIGGVLSYLQGGAICLNHLLHSLRKHSLGIKNRGFRQLIRRIGMGMSRLTFNHYRITNLTITSKDTFRLRMALLSTQVPESLSSFVYKPKDFSLCMLADTTLWLFESIKEKQYFYKRKILKNFVDSYRLENPNNFRFGGALC